MLLQDFEITAKYKKHRQVLRQLRKQNKKANSYIPGGFSTKIIPYVDFTSHRSVSKIQIQDARETITFVSNVDVSYFNEILLFFYCITICMYCQYSATLGKVEIFIFYPNN